MAVSPKTITRADLSKVMSKKVGLSRADAREMVERVLEEIGACLARGETVKLSSFGSFTVRQKGQRIGRNPKTREEVPIAPRRAMVFKPSGVMKLKINSAQATTTAASAETS